MKTPSLRSIAIACAATLVGACSAPVASTGSHSVRSPSPSEILGAYAPAGQRVVARLDRGIDTRTDAPRQPFSARLETPILDSRGQVFAPAGASVRGQIVSTGSETRPRLRLRFDAVDTVYGERSLAAALEEADYGRRPGPTRVVWSPRPGGGEFYEGGRTTPDTMDTFGDNTMGTPGSRQVTQPRDVVLGDGARLELTITRPILAPGTVVVDR